MLLFHLTGHFQVNFKFKTVTRLLNVEQAATLTLVKIHRTKVSYLLKAVVTPVFSVIVSEQYLHTADNLSPLH